MVETLRQAAAIPFRRRDGVATFCLITTAGGDKWGVPKGVIEQGGTPIDTALKEVHEEAGLRGSVVGDQIGSCIHTPISLLRERIGPYLELHGRRSRGSPGRRPGLPA